MPRIPQSIIDEMVAHAREDLPNECCGMVHGRWYNPGVRRAWARRDARFDLHGHVHAPAYLADATAAVREHLPVAVHRIKNDAASPYRYEMNPLQMMRLERARDASAETLFAIYHSHVGSPARPSPTDVRMAFFPPGEVEQEPMFPGTFYILVSLAQDPPDVRAYHIRRGGVIQEETVEVV